MATTKRTDLVYVDILQEEIRQALFNKLALFGTGAAIMNSTLPEFNSNGNQIKGGDKVVVPYFASIGKLDDVAEGGALVPRKISSSSENASVIHSGIAGEFTNWANLTAQGLDPYKVYAAQFAEAWMKRIDEGLVSRAGASSLSHDVSGVGAGLISWDAVVDAKKRWADGAQWSEIALMVVHSKVEADIWKLKDSSGRPLLVEPANQGELPRFRGVPLYVSDEVPVAGDVYTSLLCLKNSLVCWYNGEPSIDTDKDILADSQVVALHLYHVEHLYSSMPGKKAATPGVVALKTKASA